MSNLPATKLRLGIFAKYWRPGTVKTRLSPAVRPEHAASFHHVCLKTLLQRLRTFPADRVLSYTPADSASEFEALATPDWHIEPQSDGDLGNRMEHFFDTSFELGYEKVVVLGADIPTLPISIIEAASDGLESNPVAIGPSEDGGYYLLGLSRPIPDIFRDIRWGTSSVLDHTRSRLSALNIEPVILPYWYDVDEIADVRRLAAELFQNPDPSFQELQATVTDMLIK